MSSEAIYERLTGILRNIFDDDTVVAVPTLTAKDVYGWDSLAHMRVIAAVERAFAVKFAAAHVSALKNVGDLVSLIEAKLNASV